MVGWCCCWVDVYVGGFDEEEYVWYFFCVQ